MQKVIAIEVPTVEIDAKTKRNVTEQFIRVWDGPLLPVGSRLYPFVDDEWLMAFEVMAITATPTMNEILLECEVENPNEVSPFSPDEIVEMEADLRQGGWLPLNEFYPRDETVTAEQRGRMRLTFMTRDMSEDMFAELESQDHVKIDGVGKYTVGEFVEEATNAAEEDKEQYSPEAIEQYKQIDLYFLARGAARGQTVFIEHG